MDRSRRTFLAIVTAAAVVGGVIYGVGMDGQLSLPGRLALPGSTPVEITVASSVTKSKWLAEAVARFTEADIRTDTGQRITITTSNVLSGDSMLQIADGSLQPTVWSPGETAWVDQLNERWNRAHPTAITSAECAPTVLTPVGLAMWQPMQDAANGLSSHVRAVDGLARRVEDSYLRLERAVAALRAVTSEIVLDLSRGRTVPQAGALVAQIAGEILRIRSELHEGVSALAPPLP